MISCRQRGYFVYSCFKLADSVWIVRIAIEVVSGLEGGKVAYNVTDAGFAANTGKRIMSTEPVRLAQMKRSGLRCAKALESAA